MLTWTYRQTDEGGKCTLHRGFPPFKLMICYISSNKVLYSRDRIIIGVGVLSIYLKNLNFGEVVIENWGGGGKF